MKIAIRPTNLELYRVLDTESKLMTNGYSSAQESLRSDYYRPTVIPTEQIIKLLTVNVIAAPLTTTGSTLVNYYKSIYPEYFIWVKLTDTQ